MEKKRILILGGGFAGAFRARRLEKYFGHREDVEVGLVSLENFLVFTPMLHEVAGADVNVTDIVQPLRNMLRRTRVGIADVEAIDLTNKRVRIRHKDLPSPVDLSYHQLVLALGAVTNFYGIPGLGEHALTMKSFGDAIIVRSRIIDALELADNLDAVDLADNQTNEDECRKTLTVVVAGGGFAGVETAGSVNDFLREAMKFYRHVKEDWIRVVLVHPGDMILPELSESLGRYAREKLSRRRVEIRLKTKVTGYHGQEVILDDGTKIPTRILIWTAGTTPAPVLANLPCALQRGRVMTDASMQVPGWPGVWALGDCALVPDALNPGKFYPPTAQHAIRQAVVLGDNIAAAFSGRPSQPFKFKLLGMLACIGRRAGVAEILGLRFSGYIAWLLWRGIYLSKLPGFQKKVRVGIDWMLDLVFSKDLVQLPILRSPTVSQEETSSERRAA